MADHLEKSILAAILYFDVFDYPLTLIEAHGFVLDLNHSLSRAPSLSETRICLERSAFLKGKISSKRGFFFAAGSDKIIKTRHERYVISKQKLDSAQKIIRLLSRVPFVRAIFLCNSMSIQNARNTSDIDLIIIAKKGGVWWARLFCLLLLWAMRARPAFARIPYQKSESGPASAGMPGRENAKNKICLSMFADEDHFDFSGLKMGKRDIDFMYWVNNFYPLYDPAGLYKKFFNANKQWLKQHLPNARMSCPHPSRIITTKPRFRVPVEWILGRFSIIAEMVQRLKFPEQIRCLINQDTRVRVEHGLLKFHVNDKRLEHLEKFVKKYEKAVMS